MKCIDCGREKFPNASPRCSSCARRHLYYAKRLPKIIEVTKRLGESISVVITLVNHGKDDRYMQLTEELKFLENNLDQLADAVQLEVINNYFEQRLKRSA